MKKLITVALLWVLFMVLPLSLMAQISNEINPTENLQNYFASLAAFAAIVIPVTGIILRLFKVEKKWIKQNTSWLVALALGFIAWWFQWGIFAAIQWYECFIYCIAGALIANGIFNIVFIKTILKVLKLQPKEKSISKAL